ncbi:MAG: DUF3754 domain-containing protein [Methylococcales bacterium]|nr:DUF3754 domain-containing protein [Methylococcales bacterium]
MKTIAPPPHALERFIPITIDQLIQTLCQSEALSADQKQHMQAFCQQYRALYSAQTLPSFQKLTHHYSPFNPDIESAYNFHYSDNKKQQLEDQLLQKVTQLLNNANYEQLSLAELKSVLEKTSPYGVKVSVDFNDFSEILVFYRGRKSRHKEQRDWKHLYLTTNTQEVKLYSRLFILLKQKPFDQQVKELVAAKKISAEKATRKLNAKLSKNTIDDDKIYIKLFKDIPCSDLEMLFPNTKIQMRLFDKLKLGVTGGGGTVGGIVTIMGKLAMALDPVSIITAVVGFLGLLWRQISKVFTQRTKYMAELAKNLYFYNLDNNLGALAHINNMAADSEAKETLLSYFFLLTQGEMTITALDQKVEQLIKDEYGVVVDFEVHDGLAKLKKLGLLIEKEDRVSVCSQNETEILLKRHWQSCYKG